MSIVEDHDQHQHGADPNLFGGASASGIDAAADIRPVGLDDVEWALVRRHREERADQDRRNAMWASAIRDLSEAAASKDPNEDIWDRPDEAWDKIAIRFVERADAQGWRVDEEVQDFACALMRASGFEERRLRSVGQAWVRSKP
jgi:hypothetical protein